MITDEKIKQLQKQLSRGIPEGEIRTELQQQGYSEEDIQKVFAPRSYDMRSWLLASAITVLLGNLLLLFTGAGFYVLPLGLVALLFAEYIRQDKKIKKKNADQNATTTAEQSTERTSE